MNVDLLVHQRLRQSRSVLFVVTQTAEADDVDNYIAAEALAELHG